MKYYIATRTRKQMFAYSVCETLEQATEAIQEDDNIIDRSK